MNDWVDEFTISDDLSMILHKECDMIIPIRDISLVQKPWIFRNICNWHMQTEHGDV